MSCMRYRPINPQLFTSNRANLAQLLLPNSLAVVNANDRLHPSADSTLPLRQNSDLFYLTGIDQEESILLLYPGAHDEKLREILFVRESSELLATWEGHKLTKEEAKKVSGIKRVEWLSEFYPLFNRLMRECEHVYLNSNEYSKAVIEVESRDARFIRDTQARFPLHDYHRLARLMHRLRSVKCELAFDATKPDGTPRKLIDCARLHGLGWKPSLTLAEGIRRTVACYREEKAAGRARGV